MEGRAAVMDYIANIGQTTCTLWPSFSRILIANVCKVGGGEGTDSRRNPAAV